MDIICPRCGEPWENDTLHEWVAEGTYPDYRTAHRAFQREGCDASGWDHCHAEAVARYKESGNAAKMAVLIELLGDDSDGIAAMAEDFGL